MHQYVFDGNAPKSGYEPKDKTNPLNLYGETKLAGEEEILAGIASGARGTILRVPVLYGDAVTNDESAINVRLFLLLKTIFCAATHSPTRSS